jgi:diketogulonate reductase-like aldo/keto reductase
MTVNDDFRKMYKEMVLAYFSVLFQHWPDDREESHNETQSGLTQAKNHVQ